MQIRFQRTGMIFKTPDYHTYENVLKIRFEISHVHQNHVLVRDFGERDFKISVFCEQIGVIGNHPAGTSN